MQKEKTKTCNKCKEIKSEMDFYPTHKTKPDLKHNRCKDCTKKYMADWHKKNPERTLLKKREWEWALKKEAFKRYGTSCRCCGENNPFFLTMDHINGRGRLHKKERPVKFIYRWLKHNNYPENGFQTLCWNCNCTKGAYGMCPHKKEFNYFNYSGLK